MPLLSGDTNSFGPKGVCFQQHLLLGWWDVSAPCLCKILAASGPENICTRQIFQRNDSALSLTAVRRRFCSPASVGEQGKLLQWQKRGSVSVLPGLRSLSWSIYCDLIYFHFCVWIPEAASESLQCHMVMKPRRRFRLLLHCPWGQDCIAFG